MFYLPYRMDTAHKLTRIRMSFKLVAALPWGMSLFSKIAGGRYILQAKVES